MPLKGGASKKAVSSNIEEMLHKYKESGTIGKTRPTSMAHARRIAIAAAFEKKRAEAKKKRRKKRIGK